MKRETFSSERLKKYCDDHDIAVPPNASRLQLEAAIARSFMHQKDISPHNKIGCFGLFTDADMNCVKFCRFKDPCFKVSLGTDEKKLARFEKKVNKIRFSTPNRKSR